MFRSIVLKDFPPFNHMAHTFGEVKDKPDDLAEVHLLTGVNGTGKTRLLSLFAALLGNPDPLMKRIKGTGVQIGRGTGGQTGYVHLNEGSSPNHPPPHPGWSTFSFFPGGMGWQLSGPVAVWMNSVPAFAYNGTAYLADAKVEIMPGVIKPTRVDCLSFSRESKDSAQLVQYITNIKLQAAVDAQVVQNVTNITVRAAVDELTPTKIALRSQASRIVKSLETAIAGITGQSFQFYLVVHPRASLRVIWGEMELQFDMLPDGLRSIIGWMAHALVMVDAWLEGKGDPSSTEAVFLLDELESHLHPVWQRKILPAFQRLFPRSRIFVATHSPFVIASLNKGWIHRFRFGNRGLVKISAIEASSGDSYITVLEDIMGLKEWYDPETETMLADFRSERERAYAGDTSARAQAIKLALEIGKRSLELDYMMGKELAQMERQLPSK